MHKIIIFFVLFTLIAFLANGSDGIVCYDCNSSNDPRCGDPFVPHAIGKINCSLRAPLDHLEGMKPTLCRKVVQTIYGKVRVVRGCGYLQDSRDDNECYSRSGTHDVQTLFCSCKSKDECNTASKYPPFSLYTYFALTLFALYCFAQ